MKVVEKNKKNQNNQFLNFLNFPSKLNLLSLCLIVVVYGFLIGIGISCAVQDKKYIVIPEYEEMSYSEDINMFYKIYSNYTLKSSLSDDDKENFNPKEHLDKADTLLLNYYGVNNKKSVYVKANASALYDDETMKYYTTKIASTSTKTGVFYLNSGTKQSNYPTDLFCDVDYNVEGEVKNYNLKFSKKLLTLSKNDFKESYVDNIKNAAYKNEQETIIRIFSNFRVTLEAPETSDSDVNKIKLAFTLTSDAAKKYILDMQLFAVDSDDNVYNLIGFYNMSNNTLTTYSQSINLYKGIDVKDVYVKVNYVDSTGNMNNLLYKQEFKNL